MVQFLGAIHHPLHAATNVALVELLIEGSELDTASAIVQFVSGCRVEFQALLDPNRIAAECSDLARRVAYGKAKPSDQQVYQRDSEPEQNTNSRSDQCDPVDAMGSYESQEILDVFASNSKKEACGSGRY